MPHSFWRYFPLSLLWLLLSGCSSNTPLWVEEGEEAVRRLASVDSSSPWEIPAVDLGTQRLYRFQVSGKDGGGRFRLTLRLQSPELFQLLAADPLGRSLWSLHFHDRKALLIEHRQKRVCRFDEAIDLSELYLGSFPMRFLPSVLLGRVPAQPSLEPIKIDGQLRFWDEVGQQWTVSLGEGTDSASQATAGPLWSLEDPSGMPLASLRREKESGWSVLQETRNELRLRWREVVREPLEGELEPLKVPRNYGEGGCLDTAPSTP